MNLVGDREPRQLADQTVWQDPARTVGEDERNAGRVAGLITDLPSFHLSNTYLPSLYCGEGTVLWDEDAVGTAAGARHALPTGKGWGPRVLQSSQLLPNPSLLPSFQMPSCSQPSLRTALSHCLLVSSANFASIMKSFWALLPLFPFSLCQDTYTTSSHGLRVLVW